MPGAARAIKRRWRFYETASGRSDVREQLQRPDKIPGDDAAGIIAAMREVEREGRAHPDVNHLRADLWQLEVSGQQVIYRLLFAEEGTKGRVLLALHLVNKKWQKTKKADLDLADHRLADWRARGRSARSSEP